jgi:hypothetical protein
MTPVSKKQFKQNQRENKIDLKQQLNDAGVVIKLQSIRRKNENEICRVEAKRNNH